MPTSNGRNHGFVKDSLEQAQSRLEAFEKEAEKVLAGLRSRSKSSRKELGALIEKFQAGELFEQALKNEKKVEKQLRKRANELSGEVAERLGGVQERLNDVQDAVLRFAGVASRDQVEDLVSELEKISKRLDKIAKANAAAKKKSGKSANLDA